MPRCVSRRGRSSAIGRSSWTITSMLPEAPGGIRYLRSVDLVALKRLAPTYHDVGDLSRRIAGAQPGVALPEFLARCRFSSRAACCGMRRPERLCPRRCRCGRNGSRHAGKPTQRADSRLRRPRMRRHAPKPDAAQQTPPQTPPSHRDAGACHYRQAGIRRRDSDHEPDGEEACGACHKPRTTRGGCRASRTGAPRRKAGRKPSGGW